MSAALDGVLARFQGVRRSGAGWKAMCPAHAGKNPSLSVREENGRVLLKCFAGCTVGAICASVGIKISALFSDPSTAYKPVPGVVYETQRQLTGLHGRLTPRDRERGMTVVFASRENPDPAFARALALAVEGELVQVAFGRGE